MSLIRYVTKIHFADGIVEPAIAAEVEALGLSRPLIITDDASSHSGLLDLVRDALPDVAEGYDYSTASAPPAVAAAGAAARLYEDAGCDGLIGLGTAAAIDLAKAIAVVVSHEHPLSTYDAREGGIARIKDVLPPLIAIPTTAGTGAEAGCSAHLVQEDGSRIDLVSPVLVPRVAICDPTLTIDQPPELTAGAGMEALTHCVETYLSTAYNPPADGIALEGLKRAAAHIERAVEKGEDLNARRELMAASINGALALQKGLGGVHAASHALGGLDGYTLQHGALNAVLLPHVLTFNAPAVADRYSALEQAMGLSARTGLAEGIAGLAQRLGLPAGLKAMGVDDAAIKAAAPLAERDHTNGTNPRRASASDYRAIMQAAL